MISRSRVVSCLAAIALLVSCASGSRLTPKPGVGTESTPTGVDSAKSTPTGAAHTESTLVPSEQASTPEGPYALLSRDRLLAMLSDLTGIQPYSGWRNSGTEGEAEALDYAAGKLNEYVHLKELGLELERQAFHVYLSTELWEARLYLTIGGKEVEVPASGLRGPRDEIGQALRFDSDGTLNDSARNPVQVDGPVALIHDKEDVAALAPDQASTRVVFLDHAMVDRVVLGTNAAVSAAWQVVEKGPAGLVVVTQNSNVRGVSHGAFIGDNGAFNWVEAEPRPPVIYVRLEDLAAVGIARWEDLSTITRARLVWDADVFSPGTSSNLVAYIPGADPSRAVILGAHIDSPNNPGAMDDGSGSVVLLEVARVINDAGIQPPVDLYLAWFGSEELGLYGSAHFALTHQELLDRTMAMLEIDCLSRPLDGIQAELTAVTWSYGRLGDGRLLWPEFLVQAAARQGVPVRPVDIPAICSDNSSLAGYGVPQADLIYANETEMEATGSLHYAAHLHDPYDDMAVAREMGAVLEQMARAALSAALETGRDASELRVAPASDLRAVFVASHTEAVHVTPSAFTDLGMALVMQGYDVDVIPYGQPVTAADLADAALVFVLPVLDYPSAEGDISLYDDAWSSSEVEALEQYVNSGGFLVLTNSANRLKYANRVLDPNEDWGDMNALSERFGVSYASAPLRGTEASLIWDDPVVVGKTTLRLAENNGVSLDLTHGRLLAEADGKPAMVLVDHGSAGGHVLVLADVGMLGSVSEEPANLFFWQNLARQARTP